VSRALRLPERELPRIERGPRRPPDPALEARLEHLKARRNELAIRFDLTPGVLCPNGTLEAIARTRPGSLDELRGIPGVRRWQVEAFGQDLLDAVAAAEGETRGEARQEKLL